MCSVGVPLASTSIGSRPRVDTRFHDRRCIKRKQPEVKRCKQLSLHNRNVCVCVCVCVCVTCPKFGAAKDIEMNYLEYFLNTSYFESVTSCIVRRLS